MSAGARAPALPEVVLLRGALTDSDADGYLAGAEALILPILPGDATAPIALDPAIAEAAEGHGLDLLALARLHRLRGAPPEAAVVALPHTGPAFPAGSRLPERLVLVGFGGGTLTDLRHAGAALGRACDRLREAVILLPRAAGVGAESVRALVEGFLLAAYRPPRTGVSEGPPTPLARLVLVASEASDDDLEAAVDAARRAARATWTVRRLAATPSNVKTPAWFAEQASLEVAAAPGTSILVHDEGWLAEQGFGGLLAVGSGSASPPRLVVVDYRPEQAAPGARHVVLVGKGITFDSGGLSLKDRDSMIAMKTDMAGAGAALAAVVGAAHAAVPHHVTAVLPLAENALGAASYRPGDVLTMWDGTTVEVLNTDAEGRLVLADALAWTAATLKPELVVDIATLTGAASLGLGKRHGALYATDEALADGLGAAAAATGERTWRMPLVPEYESALDSTIADVANIATNPYVRAGSITAALFLRRFTGGLAWAHLDIAGPARAAKTEHEVTEGPSGYGGRLLLRWLEDLPVD